MNSDIMKIDNNTMVSLTYELREKSQEGRIIEVVDDKLPMNFIFGTGRLLPHFEANLYSLSAGDTFKFLLNSSEAYGDRREEMVINVPLSVFHDENGILNEEICRVGNNVPMMDGDGNHLNGLINEISGESVKMDFNHPMAGVDLFFSGKILNVREATAEELTATTSHSCSSCGSHSDGCGGSCQ